MRTSSFSSRSGCILRVPDGTPQCHIRIGIARRFELDHIGEHSSQSVRAVYDLIVRILTRIVVPAQFLCFHGACVCAERDKQQNRQKQTDRFLHIDLLAFTPQQVFRTRCFKPRFLWQSVLSYRRIHKASLRACTSDRRLYCRRNMCFLTNPASRLNSCRLYSVRTQSLSAF